MPSKIGYAFEKIFISLTKKMLGQNIEGVVVRSKNGLMLVDLDDRAVGRNLRRKGAYALDEIEQLKKYIKPDSRVLVVGAHIGTLVIPLSKMCAEIVALEANPETYSLLTKNVALNGAANCRTYNLAAGEKDEEIKFLLNKANSGGSKRVPKIKLFRYYYDNPKEVLVKSVSLDKLLNGAGFDLIVMDIEGSEYFALKGMPQILANCRVLAVEFEPHHLKNVSGVTVEQFAALLAPHFSKLTIPSKNKTITKSEFVSFLSAMYNKDEGDKSILFEK